jgi:hypothetical protein
MKAHRGRVTAQQVTSLGEEDKMIHSQSLRRRRFTALAGAALLALSLGAADLAHTQPRAAAATAPIAKGQKVVMATHSFNVFVGPTRAPTAPAANAAAGVTPAATTTAPQLNPGPLATLAAERNKAGHETLAVQMIGGSTPMQHWKQGDGDDAKNIAKAALVKGGPSVDVFTMSPNALMPEPGIDLFGDFVIKTNPNARIMVQNSWSSWDGTGTTPAVGGTGNAAFTAASHDQATPADLDRWMSDLDKKPDGYLIRMRTQLEGVNKRAGKQIAYVVPSAIAVYNLRKEIIAGRVPGVTKQSEIFRDGIGHPQQPLANVVTYVWYAAMYRESPVGLQALVNKADPTSAAREKLLQQIAWNAVIAEPMSGVKGQPVKVGG